MTNKEATDLLDNLIGMVEDNQDSDYDTALKMGINALTAQQWIPCSERLPDKPDVYLVSSEGISVTVAFFADGKWTTPTYLPLIGIDAWKPIGEPWKGEKE